MQPSRRQTLVRADRLLALLEKNPGLALCLRVRRELAPRLGLPVKREQPPALAVHPLVLQRIPVIWKHSLNA